MIQKYHTFGNIDKLLISRRFVNAALQQLFQNSQRLVAMFCLFWLLAFSGKALGQCSNYQVFESFTSTAPTGGGAWTKSPLVTYNNTPLTPGAHSGSYYVTFGAVNYFMRTPLITNPGVFSFWYARDTNTNAHSFNVQTSPDGATWTTVGSTTSPVANYAYEYFSVDLGALGLTNVYVRIIDARGVAGGSRYIDDVAWTTTGANTLIPALTSCSQTIACGTTYSFTDTGSTDDTYGASTDQTITFLPSVSTSKVQMVFSAFNTESGQDGMVIYDGPSIASPMISSGLAVGANATNCPAGSFYGTTSPGTITSTDPTGAITIRFRSSATVHNAGWIASVTCFAVTACATPTAQPTAMVFGTIDTSNISGSFTAASPAANKYLVAYSTSATVPSPGPVNGTSYTAGNTFGGATVASVGSGLNFTASGLNPGTTYYFYVYALNDVTCTGGPAYLTTSPLTGNTATMAPAVNDICSTAIAITSTVACSPTTGSTIGATDNDESGDCTIGTEKVVWYKFTAVSNTHTVNVDGIAGFDAVIGALSICGTTTVPAGGSCTNFNGDDGVETLFLTGLTVGNTYYIQVYDANGDNTANSFTICVTHPAPCAAPSAQPTSVVFGTVSNTSIAGSFTAASPAPNKYLVVYSTSATAPSPGPANNTVYTTGDVFSGATVVSVGNTTAFTASGLIPNTHYYFYIYSLNDIACTGPVYLSAGALTGNTTTTNAISNDICASATSLTSNTSCSGTVGSTLGATDNNETGDCTTGTEKAVWYKFTAVSTTHTVTVEGASGFDPVIGALSACGSATAPTGGACTDNTFGGDTETMTLTGLTIGNTYYIQVYDWWGVTMSGAFTICVTHTGPCTTPAAQPTSLTFTAVTANSISGSFTAASPAPNKYIVVRSTSATAPSPGPANGTTYVAGSVISGATVVSVGNATTFTATALSPTTQYYFYIYAYNDLCTGGPIYLTTSPLNGNTTTLSPPTNYLCAAAAALPCATTNLAGTTVGASNTPHGTACTMSNYGVWYTFIGDGNQTTVSSTATSGWDHEMSISSGSCGSFTNIACEDSGFSNGTESYTFTTVAGVNYYVYIAHYDSASATTGTFIISRTCTSPPPPMTNDNCSGAIPLTVNLSCAYTTYTNATATASAGVPAPGCANYLGGDVWFSAVVPANGILYFNTYSGTVTDGGMAIYTGSCGGLTLLQCDDSSSSNPNDMPFISRTGLTPGSTVYIRFWEYGNNNNGTFQICVTSPESCTTGTGLGTSALGCPTVVSGGLSLNGADPAPVNACLSSTCVDLEATYLQLGQTTDYTVSSIAYTPPYQFGCLANPVSVNVDDIWSPTVTLPFNFCFYGNTYNQCLIGSNGVLTFDLAANTPGGYSTWSFANNLPNASLFKNSIFGVYHDIDPSKGGEVGWELITLSSGCRALVASWNNIPMFSSACNSMLYTGMMVLYENTNIIEVYIKEKNVCGTWNGGNAIVGVQNATGAQGVAAPGRNALSADWTVTSEAWRFTPSGSSITTIKWYEGVGTTGPVVGTTATINVCPTATTTYTAEVSYDLCNGGRIKQSDQTTVTVMGSKTWNGSVSTAWDTDSNWTPTGKPTATDCVVVPVTARNPIISGSGYLALAGTLSVLNNATLTVNSNNSITVTDWVSVGASGTFLIQNSASLVQINDVANTGNIIYKRDAPNVKNLDYVYWSSPVAGYNVNSITAPLTPGPIYSWNPTIANPNGGQGNWVAAGGSVMQPTKGYIVRAPGSFTTTPATLSGSFTGVPNNGTISTIIYRGNDTNTAFHTGLNGTEITNFSDNNNLIGNPYPSAIQGSQFLFNNNTKIEGNIKLWTHGALPAVISSPFYNSFIYNYNVNDYLTFNFTGTSCCPAAGSDLFIGAGQGFVVQMKDGPAASDVVTFTNSLRSAGFSNSIFYRTTSHTSPANSLVDLERHRIWLDLIDFDGRSDRTLIGYIEGASIGRDSFYDAGALINTGVSIYSMIGIEKFTIQGRALPFDAQDIVPLSVVIPAAGGYKIAIGAVDGLFTSAAQNIYLEDRDLGIFHNLREEPYSFTEDATGAYGNRFFLRYNNNALGTYNPNENQDITAFIEQKQLLVQATQNIESIEVYEVSGKLVARYLPKQKSRNFSDDFNFANGIYFAKIRVENGLVFTKKLNN